MLIPEKEYEGQNVMNPYVIYDEEEKIFKMWYASGEYIEPDNICFATSSDGINWVKYSNNPIMKRSLEEDAMDNYKIGACEVYKLSTNKYLMFYIGYTDLHTARIFYAISNDGISWKRNSKNPIIYPDKYSFAKEATYKPTAIYNKKENKWMLWYNGRNLENEYIGLAICKDCKFEF